MFPLRTGYFVTGIVTGFLLLCNLLWSLPDGKLHITFCNVGQGDATYIRFPDGQDMLVDGGPGNAVLSCLGKHMPFWDRRIDIVLLSHPEKDHMGGLLPVLMRYRVGYVVRSDVEKGTDTDTALFAYVRGHAIPEKLVIRGSSIQAGKVTVRVLWPSQDQIAMTKANNVLGAATESVNRDGVMFWLRYKTFDAFFPGDADIRVSGGYVGGPLADNRMELLKVPHHGSKTGMDDAFLNWVKPALAVISVGKNSFGHPAVETIRLLADHNIRVLRTDEAGDIEIVSDGVNWRVER